MSIFKISSKKRPWLIFVIGGIIGIVVMLCANKAMYHFGTDEFVTRHAQAMSLDVCRKHIALYVNRFSVDLGEKGRLAVQTLLSKATAAGLFLEEFNIF